MQEIAKVKLLRSYAFSHHNYRLSTVATFSRPNRVEDLLFTVSFFYFGPVLVGSKQILLLACARLYEDPRNCVHGPQLGVC